MPRRNSATEVNATTIANVERRVKAIELRRAGVTYERIAFELNYSDRGRAYHDIHGALRALVDQPAQELLAEELDTLNAMLLGLWPKARKGDSQAVLAVLKIMERRAKYLGLDAAVKFEGDLSTVVRYIIDGVNMDLL